MTLPTVDLATLPADAAEAEADRLAAAEASRPFDLAAGPLWRACLVRLGERRWKLFQTLHHAVFDGWSVAVLVRELAAFYAAGQAGGPARLPALPVQYGDYAAWQRDWLDGEVLEAQLAHWRHRLEGVPPLPDLPTDRPRPAVQRFRGRRHRFRLGASPAAVAACAEGAGATPFMVYLGVFAHLLSRWSGSDDLVVGTPVANRRRGELEGLVGLFANTLALRVGGGGDARFSALLEELRDEVLAAYAHQDLPFERLVRELDLERATSHAPLVQVMLVLRNQPRERLALPGLQLTSEPVDGGGAKLDLTLFLTEDDGATDAVLEYDADLFDSATVERLATALDRLLAAAVAAPGRPLAAHPLVEADETALLRRWSAADESAPAADAPGAAPEPGTLHGMVLAQAARTPGAVAVETLGGSAEPWTYRDLDRASAEVARRLRAAGVRPGEVVGLLLGRSPRLLAALLGVLRAGAAYLPLDLSYPDARLTFLLADAGVRRLVVDEASAARAARLAPDAEVVPAAGPEDGSEDGAPDAEGMPDGLAYALYTSGTTGRPKGTLISHRSAAGYVAWAAAAYGPVGSAALGSPLAFDLTVTALFTPWVGGGRVVLLPEGDEVGALAATAGRRGFDLVKLTPSHLEALEALVPVEERSGWLGGLVLGGEALRGDALAAWLRGDGGGDGGADGDADTRVWNEYGPTEATVGCCVHRLGEAGPAADRRPVVPVGRPAAGARLWVVDGAGRLQPPGVPGELWIGGPGLAWGYLGRPALTADRFRPDPFGGEPGGRLYRSGDRVRWLASGPTSGRLEFLGRLDRQVKLRGHRVEPAEVEAVAGEVAGVRGVAVLLRREPRPRLVAWYAGDARPRELRDHLAQRLPAYAVPAAFVEVDELPLTVHGKLDTAALPAPPDAAAPSDGRPPSGQVEATLAGIWAAVLGRDEVTVDDDFFRLGGDSIASIQVIARARKAGLHLTPRQFIQHPTVRGQAAVATAATPGGDSGPVVGESPLTPVQSWFFQQRFADPEHWNQALLLRPRRPLEQRRLAAALHRLHLHHDALRLAFPGAAGEGVRRAVFRPPPALAAAGGPRLGAIDLTSLPAERRAVAVTAAGAALQRAYDLETGWPLRAALFQLGDGGQRLLLVAHHLVVDGVSWRLLLDDLAHLLTAAGVDAGAAAELPPRTTSVRRWVEHLGNWAASPEGEAEADFWLDQQLGQQLDQEVAPAGPLAAASPGPEAAARRRRFVLPAEETERLVSASSQRLRADLGELVTAAVVHATARLAGTRAVSLALEGHGRDDPAPVRAEDAELDLSRTAGWLTALYPLAFRLPETPAGGVETLNAVKEALRAVPAGGVGFGALRHLGPDAVRRRLAALPTPAVKLNYHGRPGAALEGGEAPFRPATEGAGPPRSPRARRSHPLEVEATLLEEGLRLDVVHGAGLAAHAVQAFADDALEFLTTLARDPDKSAATPADFPLLKTSQAKLDRLMDRLGGASRPSPRDD